MATGAPKIVLEAVTNGVAAPDLRMRRAYTTTVVLRNRIETP